MPHRSRTASRTRTSSSPSSGSGSESELPPQHTSPSFGDNANTDDTTPSSDIDKDYLKQASKSYGYIQRSIELLGQDSTRLAGARDFSNTLHWTQAMKFLKERGYIYTKTGHGTSVAEQFVTLEGLQDAFQQQVNQKNSLHFCLTVYKFQLENFPLPRLSKAHLEKTEGKLSIEEHTPKLTSQQSRKQQLHENSTVPYVNYVYNGYFQDKKASAVQRPTPVPASLFFSKKSADRENQRGSVDTVSREGQQNISDGRFLHSGVSLPRDGLSNIDLSTKSMPPEPLLVSSFSAPDCPLRSTNYYPQMKPPTVDQFLPCQKLDVLPPFAKISQLPDEQQLYIPKSSNIHTLLQNSSPFHSEFFPPLLTNSADTKKRSQSLPSVADQMQNFNTKKPKIDSSSTWSFYEPHTVTLPMNPLSLPPSSVNHVTNHTLSPYNPIISSIS
jgi:hypothetical protein